MAGQVGAPTSVVLDARARIELPTGPEAMLDFSVSIWGAGGRQGGPRNRPLGALRRGARRARGSKGDTHPANGFGLVSH
jgi:hypothetical protein